MKYFKRLKIYKDYSGNCTFNSQTMDAHSYSWWRFVALIDGLVVFNNYRYSVTTAKHQRKVHSILNKLGIKIDIEMPLPHGIRHDQTLAEMIQESEEHLCDNVWEQELKREDRNEKARTRRLTLKQDVENAKELEIALIKINKLDVKP